MYYEEKDFLETADQETLNQIARATAGTADIRLEGVFRNIL
jgi:hypothetical protein